MVTRMPIRRAVGVLGRPEQAEVDDRGAVHAIDGSWRLDWWIGDGEDRWRDPCADPSVRQHAMDATPVFESAIRVTAGHVRQRAYAAVDRGVLVVVEVENESSLPVAVAFALRGDAPNLLSPRAVPAVALPHHSYGPPPHASVFPLAHRAVLRVAVPLSSAIDEWPTRLPTAMQVVAGWRRIDERGGRLEAPGSLPRRFALARSQLLLARSEDPATALLATAARWRLSSDAADLMTGYETGRAAQRVADRVRTEPAAVDLAALADARVMLGALGDHRAAADVDRILDRAGDVSGDAASSVSDIDDAVALVAAVRRALVHDRADLMTVTLLPYPPGEWAGADFAVHRMPTRWGEVSYAIRWHGARPALLWESEPPARLRVPTLDPAWTTDKGRGRRCSPESAQPEGRDPPWSERERPLDWGLGLPAEVDEPPRVVPDVEDRLLRSRVEHSDLERRPDATNR
jgi:hypothetical protein